MKTKKLLPRQTMRTSAASKEIAATGAGGPHVRRRVKAGDILCQPSTVIASCGHVPVKWSWHCHVLLAMRSRLLRQRGDLLASAAEPLESHGLAEADSATDEFDHDLALTQLSTQQDSLYELEAALKRIENGTYGVCEETGKAIPAARLRAIPWTRFGREVEEWLEKRGAVNRTRVGELNTVRGKRQTGS